uniref:Reverse transcriptase Ty1/copia-type domain-containing protein n=1 Tax=Brassica oleracea var. oleracea TaxID=109376 RepID=A0A0D2ZZK3_BRAOL
MDDGPDVPNIDAWDAKLHGTDGPDNNEISINYVLSGIQSKRKNVDIDDIFAYKVALEPMDLNEDHEPTSIYECTQRSDWIKWKEVINMELNSLKKRGVFGPIIRTPYDVKPVGYKWVFVRKINEHGEVVKYKAWLVAQGFSQR